MQDIFPIPIDKAVFHPLSTVDHVGEDKCVQIIDPEFSSVCPKTGLPDYGRVILQYIPDTELVELKDWKLYLRSFYGVGCFHENVTQRIFTDFMNTVKPKYAKLTIDWGARGGLHTTTKMEWDEFGGMKAEGESFADLLFTKHQFEWHNQ